MRASTRWQDDEFVRRVAESWSRGDDDPDMHSAMKLARQFIRSVDEVAASDDPVKAVLAAGREVLFQSAEEDALVWGDGWIHVRHAESRTFYYATVHPTSITLHCICNPATLAGIHKPDCPFGGLNA